MKKFLMTSLIGFLYRQCDEYELDDGEPTCPLDDFKTFMNSYNQALVDANVSIQWTAKFWSDFAHNKWTEESLTMDQKADRLKHQKVVSRGEGFKKRLIVRQFIDNLFHFNPDKHVRSAYSHNPLDPERSEQHHIAHVPPADIFHRWTYYTESNYEELRTAVQNLYAEKPDLEFAVNPYDKFDTQEDAEKFVQKHRNEVIADVLTLHNGKWNLTGSFKQNRDRVNFYNEKTAVIEEIFKQLEQDKKLGADLMRKRVARKKKKNIEEAGPEPEEFKQYRKDHPSGFESMGAEDMSRVVQSAMVHEDCPYDAVQVDVFDFRQGGVQVKKSEFFTQAEAPVELEK
jgi:hypothetical protein